jgi:WD40 repeat protein
MGSKTLKKLLRGSVFLIAIGWASTLSGADTFPNEPSKEPILRIENGLHTSFIKSVGVDLQNKYVVTGSWDKTARVWELATGRLLQVLRPPISSTVEGRVIDPFEGRVSASAISPDGQIVACAGATGRSWEEFYSIYLFDRASGSLLHRIKGKELSAPIARLIYSKDGQYLVATLLSDGGMRVYRTSDGLLVAQDDDYGDDSYGADFDETGRLVTSSVDGYIRVYSPTFERIAKKKAPGGHQPIAVKFAPPDASKLAVGFHDSTVINILSVPDLSPLPGPDTTRVDDALISLAWSHNGDTLYAGGKAHDEGGANIVIFSWTNAGLGPSMNYSVARSTIADIVALKDGGIVFGAADPALGVLAANGERTVFRGQASIDYAGNRFFLSSDGAVVQFTYWKDGRWTDARFTLPTRSFEVNPAPNRELEPALEKAQDLSVTDWNNTFNPKLNGRSLPKQEHERSRTLAIAPDEQMFVLGTQFGLRCFDRLGNERWRALVATAITVNISRDGRFAVANFTDGAIRWYRLSDGQELLTLYLDGDLERWVLWTRTGYYDASPGGEDLIGWHINRGKEYAADFFPVSRFRKTYFRPDIIDNILETYDEKRAIELANAKADRQPPSSDVSSLLPPVITIMDPQEGTAVTSKELTIRYRLRTPTSEPVTGLTVLIDGHLAKRERDSQILGKTWIEDIEDEIHVRVPEGDFILTLLAHNRHATSEPAIVNLRWQGAVPQSNKSLMKPSGVIPSPISTATNTVFTQTTETFATLPILYVLSVGAGEYPDKDLKLPLSVKDAKDFVQIMKKQEKWVYFRVREKIVADPPNKGLVQDGLQWLQEKMTAKDIAMIFLSGHAVTYPTTTKYYFLPTGFEMNQRSTHLSVEELKDMVSDLPGPTYIFIDTCYSGSDLLSKNKMDPADMRKLIVDLSRIESGTVPIVVTSSSGSQTSSQDEAFKNSLFTKALIEGLSGEVKDWADGQINQWPDGPITLEMLYDHVAERVMYLSGGKQKPSMYIHPTAMSKEKEVKKVLAVKNKPST